MFRFIVLALAACLTQTALAQDDPPFSIAVIADLHEPWAMAVLPNGNLLITEKKGSLQLLAPSGERLGQVRGLPDVDYGGQGGLGDVVLHPRFPENRLVYLSYVERGDGGTRGAAVARGVLNTRGRHPTLERLEVIWRQYPKVLGRGHYGHRLAFDEDGYLWITSGDRQKFTPAQDMQSTLGKVLRLNDDGSTPPDNPFVDYLSVDPLVDDEATYGQVWSLGHRNPLGLDFDPDGQLWVIEMGPSGGDELNRIERGANYGYPEVSNGEHYDGRPIPNHDSRPEFAAPAIWWTPVISPADLTIYRGDLFPEWRGDALAAGLSAKAIVRIAIDGTSAREVVRYDIGARIRSITEGLDGALFVLEDERYGSEGRLLRLRPGN